MTGRLVSEGIRVRVGKKGVDYEVNVYIPGGGRETKTFRTEKAAKAWRVATLNAIHKGKFRRGTGITVEIAGDRLIADMQEGVARTRSGKRYKPSVIRSYRDNLKLHVTPWVGGALIEEVTRADVQLLVDSMLRRGANASTIRNALMPLRVIYRRAMQHDKLDASPCEHVVVPAIEGKRNRLRRRLKRSSCSARSTATLRKTGQSGRPLSTLAAVRAELRGLRVQDVDLKEGVIHVEQSMDELEGVVATNSVASASRAIAFDPPALPLAAACRGACVPVGARRRVQHRART